MCNYLLVRIKIIERNIFLSTKRASLKTNDYNDHTSSLMLHINYNMTYIDYFYMYQRMY